MWVLFVAKCIVVLVCLLTCAPGAWAQTDTSDSQLLTNQQLLERLRQLESKVEQLEAKQSAPISPSAADVIVEPARENTVAPRLKLNVFGDLGFHATDRHRTISNSFYIGSLDCS